MPSPLPSPYLDTGLTTSHTTSAQFAVKTATDPYPPLRVEAYLFGSAVVAGPPDHSQAYLTPVLGGPLTYLDTKADTTSTVYHDLFTVTKTGGPYRIGAQTYTDGSGNLILQYSLFGDAATVESTSYPGGIMVSSNPYATPTLTNGITLGWTEEGYSLGFGAGLPTPYFTAKVTSLLGNGTAVSIASIETSPGVREWQTSAVDAPFGFTHSFGPAYNYEANLQVVDSGGAVLPANVDIVTDLTESVLLPGAGVLSQAMARPNNDWDLATPGWAGTVSYAVGNPWLAAQDPAPTTREEHIFIREVKPKTPNTSPAHWTPVSVSFAATRNVLRSTNSFTGAGAVTVSGAGGTAWNVTGGGASVTRALKAKWANWNTLADPDYHADDGYRTTKADYYGSDGQDIWGWSAYAYLDVDLTCPGAESLTLTVTGVTKGQATPITFTATYTLACPNGRATTRVDLLFPNEGGPFYFERVDTVAFSGFGNGSYTLHSLTLKALQQGYLKVCHANGWVGIGYAQDGAGPALLFGTDPIIDPSLPATHWSGNAAAGASGYVKDRYKCDEDGLFSNSGSIDYSGGGSFRMDGDLATAADELNRLEGMTVTYTAPTADLTDAFGSVFNLDPQGHWLHPNLPHQRLTPGGGALALPASVTADACQIPPGCAAATFVIPGRGLIGGVLEALALDGSGKRAASGQSVRARKSTDRLSLSSSDTLAATGNTDASGYVAVPVRTGTDAASGNALYHHLGD